MPVFSPGQTGRTPFCKRTTSVRSSCWICLTRRFLIQLEIRIEIRIEIRKSGSNRFSLRKMMNFAKLGILTMAKSIEKGLLYVLKESGQDLLEYKKDHPVEGARNV